MQIKIPELSLIILVGVAGCGKSTFAKKHFKPTEIVSSDHCRALICDDENNQHVTKAAFEVLNFIAAKRLEAGKLTVIDATSVQIEARKSLRALARKYHVPSAAIVFNLPERLCHEGNRYRSERQVWPAVIHQQYIDFKEFLDNLPRERFKHITILNSVAEIDAVEIKRIPLSNNLKHERGPFDIIGDVHGCFDELTDLLKKLGYTIKQSPSFSKENVSKLPSLQSKLREDLDFTVYTVTHPEKRQVILVGDLIDRGPKNPEVLRLVMDMVATGIAFCVLGNHDVKFMRKLKGKNVNLTHGLAKTVEQMARVSSKFNNQTLEFIDNLVDHYLFDGGKLVVAHAGMNEQLQGRVSGKVREFALYGQTTGKVDEFGLPERYNWAADYQGQAMVVYGHTPVAEAKWLNNTICIDTGSVFGGKLTALRYPEKELVSVPAKYTYYESPKPFLPSGALAPPFKAVEK